MVFFSNVAFGQNFQGGWVKSKFQAGENNSLLTGIYQPQFVLTQLFPPNTFGGF